MFTRLLARADDRDNFYARPAMLLAHLFSHRWAAGQVSEGDMGTWRDELVDHGLIALYADGAYLHILNRKTILRKDVRRDIRFPEDDKPLETQGRNESGPNTARPRNESGPLDADAEAGEEAGEEADAEYVGPQRPIALPADIARCKEHMRTTFIQAREMYSFMPVLSNRDTWVEKLIRDGGCGNAGVSYVLGFTAQDFIDAAQEYENRADKSKSFTAGWVTTVHNKRAEGARQEVHQKHISQEQKQAQENELAKELAEKMKITDEQHVMDEWWIGRPVVWRKEQMAADKQRTGITTEAGTKARCWLEHTEKQT